MSYYTFMGFVGSQHCCTVLVFAMAQFTPVGTAANLPHWPHTSQSTTPIMGTVPLTLWNLLGFFGPNMKSANFWFSFAPAYDTHTVLLLMDEHPPPSTLRMLQHIIS